MAIEVRSEARKQTLTRGPADLTLWSQALREDVVRDAASYAERLILVAESFRATQHEPWREKRWAASTAHVMANCPIKIRHGERLVGWHPNSHPDKETQQTLEEARAYLRSQHYWVTAMEGHMALDNPHILRVGLDAIGEELEQHRDAVELLDRERIEKLVFYDSALTSLQALQGFIERYATLASEQAATQTDPEWRAELDVIAEVCAHIAHQPARSYRDAIQLMWFCFIGVTLENAESHHCYGPGRIDQYLLPYLEAERAAGALDESLVDDLMDQCFIKCNEFAPRQMSALILGIGGRTPDGGNGFNELSHRILYSSCRTRMYFPGVDIAWHKDVPPEFMRDACVLLRNGNGQPSFFNDQLIIDGLLKYGLPYEHAVDHLPSTCTETSIQGRCNPWVAWPYINIPKAALRALEQAEGWEDLLAKTDEAVAEVARHAVAKGNADQALAARQRPFPLLSCFLEGCLETGRNVSSGGARYNFLQPEAVGISNVVDGLAAIRTLVFEQGRYTLDDFRAAIAANWEGHESLHRAIERECPKYGNDDPWVNDLFTRYTSCWCSAIEGTRNWFGGPVFPGFLGWTVWIGFGRDTGATPDGRFAGQPLANSLAPCSGVKLKGIPSTLLSASGLDHSRGLGGITFNLRFTGTSLAAEQGPDRLAAMITAALGDLGIYMVQLDIASSETLKKAQEKPEDYLDLYVRIGGYLVPFTLLDQQAQQEVIERAELEL